MAAGPISPTVQMSSSMPSVVQACCGNAPKDGTPSLILSNMKTFITPDAPYTSAARTCSTHNTRFIVFLLPVYASAQDDFSLAIHVMDIDLSTLFRHAIQAQASR